MHLRALRSPGCNGVALQSVRLNHLLKWRSEKAVVRNPRLADQPLANGSPAHCLLSLCQPPKGLSTMTNTVEQLNELSVNGAAACGRGGPVQGTAGVKGTGSACRPHGRVGISIIACDFMCNLMDYLVQGQQQQRNKARLSVFTIHSLRKGTHRRQASCTPRR